MNNYHHAEQSASFSDFGKGTGMTALTPFHQAFWAHQLTLRQHPDSAEELGSTIASARVDLNPHQIARAKRP